jgi:hypothetical protein
MADRRERMGCLCWFIVVDLPNRTTSLALMALGVVAVLACVSAIGAATTLVVLAMNDPEPAEAVVPHDRDCAVVAWKSGSVYCFRSMAGSADKPARSGPVIIQPVADATR